MPNLVIRPLEEADLPAAEQICRQAFCATLKIPDAMLGDSKYVIPRFRANPRAAFAALSDGALIGTTVISQWGSFAILGPTSIKPGVWSGGAGMKLVERVIEAGQALGVRYMGGFTFSNSFQHIDSVRRHDFWPRAVTVLFGKVPSKSAQRAAGVALLSELPLDRRDDALAQAREISSALLEGLDLAQELRTVVETGMGDGLLVFEGARLVAFGLLHVGPESEAGGGTLLLKFGAARPGAGVETHFDRLLQATEAIAREQNVARISLGMNTARSQAYRRMFTLGWLGTRVGVAMHRPDDPLYSRPDVYVIDDWR